MTSELTGCYTEDCNLLLGEIDALKAQNALFCEAMQEMVDGFHLSQVRCMRSILDVAPTQCLKEIEARAIEKAVKECEEHDWCGEVRIRSCQSADLEQYAQELRNE